MTMARHTEKKQVSEKYKGKVLGKAIAKTPVKDNKISKQSAIPKLVPGSKKTTSNVQKRNVETSPKILSKSLSPIKEKFLSQLLSPKKNRSPSRLEKSKEFDAKSNKSPLKQFDKSPNISGRNISNNSKSRRKSAPKKRRIFDENTGVTSVVSQKIWQEIKLLQRQTKTVIPIAPFLRLVRELLMQFGGSDVRIQRHALIAIQEACEAYMTQFFQDSYLCSLHAGRVTLFVKDMQLARRLRGDADIINH